MPIRQPIINLETLEVYPSITNIAKILKVSPQAIYRNIFMGWKTQGVYLEYFNYWKEVYTLKEKEKYSRKNNIYFMGSRQ